MSCIIRRLLTLLFCLFIASLSAVLAANVFLADGVETLDFVRIGLLAISAAWLAYGATIALNGLATLGAARRPKGSLETLAGRIGVVVPIYNEDPGATFSRIAAMTRSLEGTGVGGIFDVVILSDTTDNLVADRETYWLARLRDQEPDWRDRIFYRRRAQNTGKKAGNIAEFIRGSGARFEYLIILDADSLMAGSTMVEMVARMQGEPRLGLLQTLPKIIAARSWFGRAVQFSAAYYSPFFARGVAETQGETGPFWGHNAIVRTRAFAESCGMPALRGNPPFGGHVLSHDYVEAALLARNGWIVRLDADLEGSYEEGPENVIDYAKRDRRWCQGNLQHARLLAAPGLKPWSRFVFVQGIMAYVSSPIWALFLIATIVSPLFVAEPNYFPERGGPPVFPQVAHVQAIMLLIAVLGVLIGPKFLIFVRNAFTGTNRTFAGNMAAFSSVVTEIAWSSMIAPLMLMYQSRSVVQVLLGLDGGWPASNRKSETVGLREAWDASWWICATGAMVFAICVAFVPMLFYWLLPVAIPMLFAPFLIHFSSRPFLRRADSMLFHTPMEDMPDEVIRERAAIWQRWQGEPEFIPLEEMRAMAAANGASAGTAQSPEALAR